MDSVSRKGRKGTEMLGDGFDEMLYPLFGFLFATGIVTVIWFIIVEILSRGLTRVVL